MERFWSKVAKAEGCWRWTAATEDGYGRFALSRRNERAHRVAWILAHGDPGELHVLHKCDNRLCVNPEHLFLGTNADNVADREAKGRNKPPPRCAHEQLARGERHGRAKLTTANVREMRARAAAGERVARLAREFQVSHHTACDAIHGVTWRGV